MNPYQQPYGPPPGFGMPPANNYSYYGSGYQGYGVMPTAPAPPGVPYTVQSANVYPSPPMPQESSYSGYAPGTPGGYYNSPPLPYGTAAPYGVYPQGTYSGPPYNPYGQAAPSAGYSTYPGQYDQTSQPTSTVGDNNSYPAATMSYGYPSGQPYPATSSCPTSDSSSGYPMPSTSSYDPYSSTSSYCCSQVSTTVTDSIAATKPDAPPLHPTLPYGEASDETSRWRNDPLGDAHPRRGSPNNWHHSSPDARPIARPRGRANTPTGEMGDKAPGKERREEQTSDMNRGIARQTTADEWNEIADIIKEEKKQRPEDPHMDPKQLSGITADDPLARADYKRKLNALANLMTDVNLDESKK